MLASTALYRLEGVISIPMDIAFDRYVSKPIRVRLLATGQSIGAVRGLEFI